MQSHLTIPYVWWDFSQDQHALQLAFGVLVSDRATPRFRGASEIASYSTTPHFKQRARGARGSRRQPEASCYVSRP